jgi:F-box protein 20
MRAQWLKKNQNLIVFVGRGAAMIIESLRLFYHIDCFKCCVCCVQLGDGLMGTDVRVRNGKLHCHSCYSSDDGKNSLDSRQK